jgi:hypothetical protein
MAKDDFVNVQLTEFGKERAAGAVVQVHEGNHSFYFKPGEVQRVTRAFDWNRVLKTQHFNGHPLFEVVPEPLFDPQEPITEENINNPIEVVMGTHAEEK